MKNVEDHVVKKGLCTSCGVCQSACHRDAISFVYGRERNTPQIDVAKCINCGLCYEVCPGKGIRLNELSSEYFNNEQNVALNLWAGHYIHAYVGYSNEKNTRYHGATGGMVSQFLMYLLERDIIDGAAVVRYKKDNPFEPEPFIATTKEEIWESRSSKYVVISMDKIAGEILHLEKRRLVVVGLPCHIQGWRLLAKQNKKIRDSIIGYFAIYCSVNKTKQSLDYYPIRYKVNKSKVSCFVFRDDGCMGYMKFMDKRGKDLKKIPYLDYWFGTHSFFVNPRCSLCIDQLGELADISFGDIHIEPYSQDTIGTNSMITRSAYWDGLLNDCYREGYVSLETIDINTLIKSQSYTKSFKKGAGVKTNFFLRRLVGKNNPEYDYQYDGGISIKNLLVEIGKVIMRRIGRYRGLWFIITLLDRNKH